MLRYRHLDAGHNYKDYMDDKALENAELIYFVNNKKYGLYSRNLYECIN